VPLGAFLSGGVDSCAAVAAMTKSNRNRVKTFTMGFHETEFCETKYARLMSSCYDLEHTEETLTPDDVASVYDSMLWHFDEPFNDYSFFPTYYICRAARKRITVALSGDGGDEIFCGYSTFQRLLFVDLLNRVCPMPLRKWPFRAVSYLLPSHSVYKRHLMRLSKTKNEMLRDVMMFIFTRQEMTQALTGEIKKEMEGYDTGSVIDKHLEAVKDQNLDLINTMRYLSTKMTLAEDMLVKVDRASMAVSLEVRPVLLFAPLVEFVSHIPTHFLVTSKQTKSILKKSLEPWVPVENLYRKKMGFEVPLRKWFRSDLLDLIEQTKKSPWIKQSFFAELLRRQEKGQRDFTLQIHNLVFLNSWLNKWLS
ncbi:MAG: hypothetical protein IMF11_05720, partial [Proteobacteria bacterium]|nr:hypothetical protein [Pseudomonadota bacterium]